MIVMLDMDGVLCDFVRGSLSHHGRTLDYNTIEWDFVNQLGMPPAEFWAPLGFDFWAGLPWTPGGRDFYDALERVVGPSRILMTTSPCMTVGGIEGKVEWLRRHLPHMSRQFVVTPHKCMLARPDLLLIDDYAKNVADWRAAGGRAVLCPQPWNGGSEYDPVTLLQSVLEELCKP